MVQEYEADDLASGSEDEKRLEKAERAAEQKAERKADHECGLSRGKASLMVWAGDSSCLEINFFRSKVTAWLAIAHAGCTCSGCGPGSTCAPTSTITGAVYVTSSQLLENQVLFAPSIRF